MLLVVLLSLQAMLWLGEGGARDAEALRAELDERRAANEELEQSIRGVQAQIGDLQSGTEAIEERARYEMGLVRPGEPFVQYVTPTPGPSTGSTADRGLSGSPPKNP